MTMHRLLKFLGLQRVPSALDPKSVPEDREYVAVKSERWFTKPFSISNTEPYVGPDYFIGQFLCRCGLVFSMQCGVSARGSGDGPMIISSYIGPHHCFLCGSKALSLIAKTPLDEDFVSGCREVEGA